MTDNASKFAGQPLPENRVTAPEEEKKKNRSEKGAGTVFRYKGSDIWYLRYTDRCYHQVQESTRQTNRNVALRMLRRRMTQVDKGIKKAREADKTTLAELFVDVLADYRLNSKRSIDDAESRIEKHLVPFFGISKSRSDSGSLKLSGGVRAIEVSNPDAAAYLAMRLADGAALGTAANELALLKRALTLGFQNGKLPMQKYIKVPDPDNARQRRLELEEYPRLFANLPDYLKAALAVAHFTGLRREELFGLTWDRLNLIDGTIRLQDTKNGEPRCVKVPSALLEMLRVQKTIRDEIDAAFPFVFFRRSNRNEKKNSPLLPIKDFRKVWANALTAAGIKDLHWHDLRRSAVTNMVDAGVPEKVAMEISGHKTRSVFDRYHIVANRHLADAAAKVEAHLEEQKRKLEAHAIEQAQRSQQQARVN